MTLSPARTKSSFSLGETGGHQVFVTLSFGGMFYLCWGLICRRDPLYPFLFRFVLLTLPSCISNRLYNPVHPMFFPTFRALEHKFMPLVSLAPSALRVSI